MAAAAWAAILFVAARRWNPPNMTHIGKTPKKIDKGIGISSGTAQTQSDGKPLRPALRVAVSRAMATAQCGEKRSTDHGNGDHQ